jgi:hypothetical protein
MPKVIGLVGQNANTPTMLQVESLPLAGPQVVTLMSFTMVIHSA